MVQQSNKYRRSWGLFIRNNNGDGQFLRIIDYVTGSTRKLVGEVWHTPSRRPENSLQSQLLPNHGHKPVRFSVSAMDPEL